MFNICCTTFVCLWKFQKPFKCSCKFPIKRRMNEKRCNAIGQGISVIGYGCLCPVLLLIHIFLCGVRRKNAKQRLVSHSSENAHRYTRTAIQCTIFTKSSSFTRMPCMARNHRQLSRSRFAQYNRKCAVNVSYRTYTYEPNIHHTKQRQRNSIEKVYQTLVLGCARFNSS